MHFSLGLVIMVIRQRFDVESRADNKKIKIQFCLGSCGDGYLLKWLSLEEGFLTNYRLAFNFFRIQEISEEYFFERLGFLFLDIRFVENGEVFFNKSYFSFIHSDNAIKMVLI